MWREGHAVSVEGGTYSHILTEWLLLCRSGTSLAKLISWTQLLTLTIYLVVVELSYLSSMPRSVAGTAITHLMRRYGALQDDYRDALIRLHQTVTRAYQVNQNIKFEVFIHKVDGLTDDRKIGESVSSDPLIAVVIVCPL